MIIEIDKELIETRLDGLKKIADIDGEHNEYPSIYKNFVNTLEFIGLKVLLGENGKHSIQTN